MKKRKSVITLVLMVMLCFSSITVLAATKNIGVSTTLPNINGVGVIKPDSTSVPDQDQIYKNGSSYDVNGSADNSNLYTNKCFKGVSSIDFSITNNRSGSLKVKLGRYTSLGNCVYGIQTITVPGKSTTSSSFTDLSSGTYYFIQFPAPSDFSGTVTGNK
ncbi:MAG: hypothetical protein K0S25_929 [Bacillus sp. (in: firmicutes)]|jgi:hypothetical protein|nr:hypothetical protein [Bacillus sp. (in: firmicutes)]